MSLVAIGVKTKANISGFYVKAESDSPRSKTIYLVEKRQLKQPSPSSVVIQ